MLGRPSTSRPGPFYCKSKSTQLKRIEQFRSSKIKYKEFLGPSFLLSDVAFFLKGHDFDEILR